MIERLAPHVVNLHVKDFAFSRRDGWVGFELSGVPLGTGQLPLERMLDAVAPRDLNAIIELWVPYEQRELEAEWAKRSLDRLTDSLRKKSDLLFA